MITPAAVQVAYFQKSLPSGIGGGIGDHGAATGDGESEARQRWLLLQHSMECGCCFDSYPFDNMMQCPDAHIFCKSCMLSYASNLLGEHDHNIVCMDQSGCTLHFPQSQLERFLTPTLLDLYHRVKQLKEIEAAGIENLEECPFCDYMCIIEDDAEKLFLCEGEDCGVVSCRECKKPDHPKKSCNEAEAEGKLNVQHVIEEAMSSALIRNCPKCQKAFVKELFCNKMICPNCSTVSCYVCRKVINGYEHFSSGSNKSKCVLWDEVDKRHADEVELAAKKATEELQREGKIKPPKVVVATGEKRRIRAKNTSRLFSKLLQKLRARKTVVAA